MIFYKPVLFTNQSHPSTGRVPKNFPLANWFAKGKISGAGRHPTGPEWGKYICKGCLNASLNKPNSNIRETRLYSELTDTNRIHGKVNLWARILVFKVCKVWYFYYFFGFSNITVKIFMVEEFFFQINWRGDHHTLYFNNLNSVWKFFRRKLPKSSPNPVVRY